MLLENCSGDADNGVRFASRRDPAVKIGSPVVARPDRCNCCCAIEGAER